MGDSFREHGVMLYLDKTLYKAFIRLQADKGLGRSFAGLFPFVEGLHHLGYLSQQEYEDHVKKYNQPLTDVKVLTAENLEQQNEIKEWEKRFSNIIKDWKNVSEKSRLWHIEKAKELHDKVSNAKLVLALANNHNSRGKLCVECGKIDPANPYRIWCPNGKGERTRQDTCVLEGELQNG